MCLVVGTGSREVFYPAAVPRLRWLRPAPPAPRGCTNPVPQPRLCSPGAASVAPGCGCLGLSLCRSRAVPVPRAQLRAGFPGAQGHAQLLALRRASDSLDLSSW